ncbi:MAG: hypothetical protein J6B01_04865 [Ruminococcus sp.]|nr:hypothetical protein [Ruminococcus sp.]MBO5319124.1 hypothetical protein [Ruminococcus sp.]
MNETIRMEARFEFTGSLSTRPDRTKNGIIREFLKQRGLLVDILNNGIIDILNKEFDATHEWYEGIYYDEEYLKFMQEGQQKWADIVNKHAGPKSGVMLYIDEMSDIYGKTTTCWSRIPEEIHMYLT